MAKLDTSILTLAKYRSGRENSVPGDLRWLGCDGLPCIFCSIGVEECGNKPRFIKRKDYTQDERYTNGSDNSDLSAL
jgi:hypothetical protein